MPGPSPARPVRRGWAAIVASATPAASEAGAASANDEDLRQLLPPRYHGGVPVSSAPMGGAADLVWGDDDKVAWDRIWADFCDLALAGGPPHRETMLEAPSPEAVAADPGGQSRAIAELIRALGLITGWDAHPADTPGWLILPCPDADAARWLTRAIVAENVRAMAVQDAAEVRLPVGPAFTVEREIRNVVTATAKAHHYWTEHRAWLETFLADRADAP